MAKGKKSKKENEELKAEKREKKIEKKLQKIQEKKDDKEDSGSGLYVPKDDADAVASLTEEQQAVFCPRSVFYEEISALNSYRLLTS